jgi:NHLM bacteriocin system ABC transporter ATP-binding protein
MPSSSGTDLPVDQLAWAPGRQPVSLGGNRPWLLNDSTAVWGVASGEVDVFVTRLGHDGSPGSRHFLFRVGPGSLLAGTEGPELPVALLAVPAGAAGVLSASRPEVAAHSEGRPEKAVLDAALAGWMERLARSVAAAGAPDSTTAARLGTTHSLAEGGVLLGSDDLCCARMLEGSAELCSEAGLLIDPSSGWIPLAGGWLTALEAATVEVCGSEVFRADGSGWGPADMLARLLLRAVHARLLREDAAESKRLALRDEATRKMLDVAVARQASVLDSGAVAGSDDGSDPVLAACQAVGGRLGIKLVAAQDASLKGADRVTAIARASGVRQREVALEGEWWRTDNGPLAGYLESGESVALLPRFDGGYRALPQDGSRPFRVDEAEAKKIVPRAHMFYRPLPARPLSGRDIVAFVLRGNRGAAALLAAMSLVAALVGLVVPIFTGMIFNDVIPSGSGVILFQIAATLGVVSVVLGLLSFVRGVAVVRLQGRIDNSLQAALWDRLLTLPAAFFRRFTAGDLASRVVCVNQMSSIVFGSVVMAMFGAVFSLVNLFLILSLNPSLALLALGLFVLAVGVALAVGFWQLPQRRAVFDLQGKLSGQVLELVSAIAKLRDTGAEERAFARWSDGFVTMTRHTVRATRIANAGIVFDAAFPVVCAAGGFAVYYFFIRSVYQTGQFMTYTAAFAQLLAGVIAFSGAFTQITYVAPLYGRAKPLLEAEPEVDETKEDPGPLQGHIEMTKVAFTYGQAESPILKEVSLEVKPGEFVAIVGPSGAGKSTIFRLLLGFEQPRSGDVRYDGRDLRSLDVAAVRRQVSTVLQNGRVFSGTIFLNISGAAQMTQEEAWQAAEAAGLADDIKAMPMGMFTFVTEGGVTLSGGQRQRLLIARALAGHPSVLLFDEATSALDNRTQAVVMDSLASLHASRLVIAQRLSTVKAADRIYVLENGTVVQCGNFEELMAQPGLFRRLAARQLV